MRYVVTVSAQFEVEAENIMQAKAAADKFRVIGPITAGRRPPKSRDMVSWYRLADPVVRRKVRRA